jgi:hypothetical protein
MTELLKKDKKFKWMPSTRFCKKVREVFYKSREVSSGTKW